MGLDVAAVQDALRKAEPRWMAALRLPRFNPIAARSGRTHRRHAHDDAAVVLPDSRAGHAARARARDRAPQPRCAARRKDSRTRGREQLDSGADESAARASSAWRWSTRRRAPSPISRASTPAPPRLCGRAASKSSRRAISSSASRPRGRPAQLATHQRASDALYRIKDRAFERLRRRCGRRALTEYDLQQQMVDWFEEEGLSAIRRRSSRVGANAGNPHYLPTGERASRDRRRTRLLLDLWGKRREPGAVFADITWVGFTAASARTRRRAPSTRSPRRATPP